MIIYKRCLKMLSCRQLHRYFQVLVSDGNKAVTMPLTRIVITILLQLNINNEFRNLICFHQLIESIYNNISMYIIHVNDAKVWLTDFLKDNQNRPPQCIFITTLIFDGQHEIPKYSQIHRNFYFYIILL
jgi:hypothetical protein